jgi:excisionase family DNA binding protein
METLTFEQLPEAVGLLLKKVDQLELLIIKQAGQQPDEHDLLNVKQASKFLDLAIPTVYSKVCRREIPVNKKGKRLYFYKSELQAWIKAGRKRTRDEIIASAEIRQSRRKT